MHVPHHHVAFFLLACVYGSAKHFVRVVICAHIECLICLRRGNLHIRSVLCIASSGLRDDIARGSQNIISYSSGLNGYEKLIYLHENV